jgi:hypothetical protein
MQFPASYVLRGIVAAPDDFQHGRAVPEVRPHMLDKPSDRLTVVGRWATMAAGELEHPDEPERRDRGDRGAASLRPI